MGPHAPNAPEEITEEWIGWLLESNGIESDGLALGPIELIGQGFLGVVARVPLGDVDPSSLVFKFGHDDPAVRADVWTGDIYQREQRFYQELVSQVPITTPRCWFGQSSAAEDRHVLVFDDLSGHRFVRQLDGCPAELAVRVVEDLAKLHSAFATNIAAAADGLPHAHRDQAWFALVEGACPAALARADLPEPLVELTDRYPSVGPAILERLSVRETICHGDARIENVFFDGDGALTWIDWDGVQVAKGLAELAYFTSQSLTVEVRRRHERSLFDRYVAGRRDLSASPNELWDDYRLGLLAGWAVGIAAIGAYGEQTGETAALLSAGIDRVAAAIVDTDAMELIDDHCGARGI